MTLENNQQGTRGEEVTDREGSTDTGTDRDGYTQTNGEPDPKHDFDNRAPEAS